MKSLGVCKMCGSNLAQGVEDCPDCGCCKSRIHWRVLIVVLVGAFGAGSMLSAFGYLS